MDTVRFFKDHAKAQLKAARGGDPYALPASAGVRPGTVLPSLQQAQHHVAVVAGYHSWAGLLEAPEHDRQLAAVMTREGHLTLYGMGIGSFGLGRDERRVAYKDARAQLRRSADRVAEVTTWLLANITPIRTINRDRTSYQYKHVVEQAIDRYVANGELIAAGIIAGYRYRRESWDSLNVYFAMSARDVRAAEVIDQGGSNL